MKYLLNHKVSAVTSMAVILFSICFCASVFAGEREVAQLESDFTLMFYLILGTLFIMVVVIYANRLIFKDPVKTWSKFQPLDLCDECNYLQQDASFKSCCPECGSKTFSEVTARWLVSWQGSGLMNKRINHESEIREHK